MFSGGGGGVVKQTPASCFGHVLVQELLLVPLNSSFLPGEQLLCARLRSVIIPVSGSRNKLCQRTEE